MNHRLLYFVVLVSFVSCKKYEGDFTLRTPEKRIMGDWIITVVHESIGGEDWVFHRINLDKETFTATLDDGGEIDGFWSLKNEKTELSLSYDAYGNSYSHTAIIRYIGKRQAEFMQTSLIVQGDSSYTDNLAYRIVWNRPD